MIGRNQDAIVTFEVFRARDPPNAYSKNRNGAFCAEPAKYGIVVIHDGATGGEQLEQLQRRRFAKIVNILLVSHAEQQNFRALDTFLAIVESRGHSIHDVIRHFGIDFAGEFDEARGEIILSGFPGKIIGIHGNAMPPEAGPG